jgi:8-oxo-dGTP pyrophosphatase MutT (NUDIX family)
VAGPPWTFGPDLRARAHEHLAGFERRAHPHGERRPAAVALVLLPDEQGRACFLLTRRADRLRAHARQWALPGGRVDPDETAEAAALRELSEEVGLTLAADAVLGVLDDYPTRSGFVITPVVAWCEDVAELVPNPDEVQHVYLVPLDDLERPEVPILVSIPESERPVIQMPILSSLIHAPTAAVIYQLREVVVHGRPTRVDHFEQPVWAWK